MRDLEAEAMEFGKQSTVAGRRKTTFRGRIVQVNDVDWHQGPGLAISKSEGRVSIDAGGRITAVDLDDDGAKGVGVHWADGAEADYESITIPAGSFLFPGFIDTHIHAAQYPNIGIFGESTLLEWLEKYTFPLEASLTDSDLARKVFSRCVDRTLSHGTTTATYYANNSNTSTLILADECLKRGQRALVGRSCMDRPGQVPDYIRDKTTEDAIDGSSQMVDEIRSRDGGRGLIEPIVTPRFAPSCTEACLHGLGRLAKAKNCKIQTHISENRQEVDLVRELYPSSKHYVDVYDTCGLLTDSTILAHAIYLSEEELQVLKARGTKISHCPTSNAALSSGTAPVRQMLDFGLDLGLGTDVSGGYSPSILEAVRHAGLMSRLLSLQSGHQGAGLKIAELLWLATRGGARVVGKADRIGGFEVGKEFDAQLIGFPDGGPVDVWEANSTDDRVAKWVWGGDDRNVRKVWVKGRCVVDKDQ